MSSFVNGICYDGCDDDYFGHDDDDDSDCIGGWDGLVNDIDISKESSLKIWRKLDKRKPQNKHFQLLIDN